MSAASPCHNLLFKFVGHLLAFFPNSKQVYGLCKPSFLQCGHGIGMRFFATVPLVSPPAFVPKFYMRFITSAVNLVFVATNASLLVVSVAISDVS